MKGGRRTTRVRRVEGREGGRSGERQIQAKLDEEGLPDEMELHIQCSGNHKFGRRIPSLGARLIDNLGGNAPF
ncbi:hypothetical protein BLNAU_6894 [Blattamonas nauphoetae]|uniref:Uncharacterized protein n=1 Tax=Blattamonas nauphoetae TaxID=2049346 RepID=A0ABQ9Y392_9EUKA|nr:hypothetical protein BLNAU_6894 [Blattamonas nauphoetae]